MVKVGNNINSILINPTVPHITHPLLWPISFLIHSLLTMTIFPIHMDDYINIQYYIHLVMDAFVYLFIFLSLL